MRGENGRSPHIIRVDSKSKAIVRLSISLEEIQIPKSKNRVVIHHFHDKDRMAST